MLITNCVARWPGSVHDARILRESPLFADFESNRRPLSGVLLGDSGYMVREWLLTPILNPRDAHEAAYTDAHCVTRSTIERCNGVLKRRWHCLHGEIRLHPKKVCKVICVCVMLHNRATRLGLAPPDGDDDPAAPQPEPQPAAEDRLLGRAIKGNALVSERVRTAAGKTYRSSIVQNYF